ncbi:MAG: enoyl-CoA hydratase/isomerase family protein [Saprospiraceae bacterium]|nr:enoyl-CoA hydratase/isomerase family protein [Saprospiraceae bacterium]
MGEQIIWENRDGVLVVTLNRASKLNALNRSLVSELGEVVHKLNFEADCRGLIITGAGEKAFAAGADISEFANYSGDEAALMARRGHEVFNEIENSAKPVIAAINGFALGGGLELAMACHLRICSANAKFGQPEASLGLIPGYGGTQRLVQLIGKGKAMEILLTGDMLSAPDAHRLGLVNQVVEQETLMDTAFEMMNKILSKGPVAIAKTIEAVNAYFDTKANGFEEEIKGFAHCFDTNDFKEGTNAFLEKRKPEFKGN